MAKFHEMIGFANTVETEPGIYEEKISEFSYYGDVYKNNRNLQTANNVNDNVTVSNQISINADQFAIQNFYNIRYVVFMGVKWKVANADLQTPRIILTLGGVYNGEQARIAE